MKKDKNMNNDTESKRPWGSYEVLYESDATKVKKIHVTPGEVLSYQSHKKRNEDWVVVRGSGFVIIDDELLPAVLGKSFKILANQKHRIGADNNGIGIDFIEVQTGDYFGEDDITRYSDEYGRVSS